MQASVDNERRTPVVPAPDSGVPAPDPGGRAYLIVKRVFDVVFSLMAIALFAIPVAVMCLLIRLESSGAPFYRQDRIGYRGKRIHIFKLRTMYVGSHEHPERFLTPRQLEVWKREQKVDNDPRVTRIGRFLRKTSLDELPQFLNVLMGDLSVIGPRPVTLAETYEFGNARDEFLSCRPGITGWWQVTERNKATWKNGDRQQLEIFYVRHASIPLDLRIFVRTFKAIINGTGR